MKPRRILFVTGSLVQQSSGPYLSLRQTGAALRSRGHRLTVVGSRLPHEPSPANSLYDELSFRSRWPYTAHYAPELVEWLKSPQRDWDLASLQGVWMHTNRAVVDWCRRHERPYMITSHGNFNPVALQVARWKKWLAAKTFLRPVLAHASCYHALTETEYSALREYDIRQPICVIPNGIDFPEEAGDRDGARPNLLPQCIRNRRVCLYLGRLHPIKGLDRLARAWVALSPREEWVLVLAGTGHDDYVHHLKGLLSAAPADSVYFAGFVAEPLKSAWLRTAELCVLTSLSEAFPMTLLEGFAQGTPALITKSCGLPEAVAGGGAVEVDSTIDGICGGLCQLLSLGREDLAAMGRRAFEFARERYAWPAICEQLESVYDWMIDGGHPPSCLRL